MGYLHIQNLYKAQQILLFKRCYAMEKIHGTSAHVKYKDGKLTHFAGGGSHDVFRMLFDDAQLIEGLAKLGHPEVTIYGEFYGGRLQAMAHTYGPTQRFVAFDVCFGEDGWANVPTAAKICADLKIDFVDWVEISTDLAEVDAARDADSTQAIKNGMGPGKKREGVVLRPLEEFTDKYGERLIAKHKRADFEERKTPPKVIDGMALKILQEATDIVTEWLTPMRLEHVLDKIPGAVGMSDTGRVIAAMVEDVTREAGREVVWSDEAFKLLKKQTALMFKERLANGQSR